MTKDEAREAEFYRKGMQIKNASRERCFNLGFNAGYDFAKRESNDQLAAVTAERDRYKAEAEIAWGESRSNLDNGIALIKQAQDERDRMREILESAKAIHFPNGYAFLRGNHFVGVIYYNHSDTGKEQEKPFNTMSEAIAFVRGEEAA